MLGLSDMSWLPDEGDNEDQRDSDQHYQTRQCGHSIEISSITGKVDWTVPGLPVLTVPLVLGVSQGKEVAISTLHEDLPHDGPVTLLCKSSCYIHYEGEQLFLIWEWEPMNVLDTYGADWAGDYVESVTSDERDKSSEEEGDDVVVLLEESEDDDDEPNMTHTVGFKVMGVTAKNARQDALLDAKYQMSQGHTVHAVVQPEPMNAHDRNAIQVVIGVGDTIQCVGYIQRELTQYVHPAINQNKIKHVSIEHIRFRAFNPPGYYMRLLITKRGRWHNDVVRKSICAK